MVAAGQYPDSIFLHFIDQAVLLVNATGPAAGELMLQAFRLPGSAEGIALDLFDQLDDSQGFLAILFNPPRQILKGGGIKLQAFGMLRQRGSPPLCGFSPRSAASSLSHF